MVYWKPMDNLALYLHIPFCSSRCTYCDFFTSTGREDWIPDYVEALTAELDYLSRSAPEEIGISSVFLGGGTPSLLLSSQVQQLLQAVRDGFHLFPDAEITLEANPESVSQPYLGEIFLAGVNRLSLGMQTSDPDQLRLLGRRHDFPEVEEAVRGARRVGFENLNLDLIYGIPGGTVASWRDTLNAALDLEPEHLSLYGLTLEEGTPGRSGQAGAGA